MNTLFRPGPLQNACSKMGTDVNLIHPKTRPKECDTLGYIRTLSFIGRKYWDGKAIGNTKKFGFGWWRVIMTDGIQPW